MNWILNSNQDASEYLNYLKNTEMTFDKSCFGTEYEISKAAIESRNQIFFVNDFYILKCFVGEDSNKYFENELNIVRHVNNDSQVNFSPELLKSDKKSKVLFYLLESKNLKELFLELKKKDKNELERLIGLCGRILQQVHTSRKKQTTQEWKPNTKNIATESKSLIEDFEKCWEQDSFIHFDSKLENFILSKDMNHVKLIDWEMANIGDRHWDLAVFVQSFVSLIYSSNFTFTTVDEKYRKIYKKFFSPFKETYCKDGLVIDVNKLTLFLKISLLISKIDYEDAAIENILYYGFEN